MQRQKLIKQSFSSKNTIRRVKKNKPQSERRYWHHLKPTNGLHPEYIKNLYKSIKKKTDNPVKSKGQEM